MQQGRHPLTAHVTLLRSVLGMVDRGADVGWLSQYSYEREILFAPLTGLEVVGSKVEGKVLVVNVRLNVNMMSLTIEEACNCATNPSLV